MYLDKSAPCPPRCRIYRDVVNAPPPPLPTTPRLTQPDPTLPPRGAYPCVTFVTVPSSATWTLSLAALPCQHCAICSRASYFLGRGVRAARAYLSGLWSMVITSPSFTTRVSLGRSDFAKVWCVPALLTRLALDLQNRVEIANGGCIWGWGTGL